MCRKRMNQKKNKLLNKIKKIKSKPGFERSLDMQKEADRLDNELSQMEKKKLDKAAATSAARYQLKGEAVNKYWFAIGKSITDESIIHGLTDNQNSLQMSTKKMMDIATEYHGKLQKMPKFNEPRQQATCDMAALMSEKKFTEDDQEILSSKITEAEVISTIKKSQNGKSLGRDGFIYEWYKLVLSWSEKPPKEDTQYPNIAYILEKA
ncbi:hypothetical protein FRB99_006574 [Tulasnella sp. 403]|nr:hypothetical protein FRB99_006574 [Tulasnella sp. 403]